MTPAPTRSPAASASCRSSQQPARSTRRPPPRAGRCPASASRASRVPGPRRAARAAGRGARVSLVGLEPEELERTARECGPNALALEADVTKADSLKNAIETTADTTGGIDVVVANAGIAGGGPFRYMEEETF